LDYIDILQEMLRYIGGNIKEKLNIEKLAGQAGFSPYHFCRIFQWDVGYSNMEYVRNRRLAFAASELSFGRRIIDIAIDYGFETHSGFSKPADKPDFSSAIQGTWKYIFSEWFPASEYEFAANCVDFEFYDERSMGETGNVCDIYIPVCKKT